MGHCAKILEAIQRGVISMIYCLYIKSHDENEDIELEVEAVNEEEAIQKLYDMLYGECDRDFIRKHLLSA